MNTKFIFICGGVMSGIGKGVATASIGRILKSRGFKVTAVKIDPYINVDAGTMNPVEHGEVFVTEDGMECDQDVGNYERFLEENILSDNYMTTGSVYKTVIEKERNLEYNGKCVEVVPHIPEEVIRRLERVAKKTSANFVLVEIGGTVGEYQNALFLEAGRMLKIKKPKDVLFILVSYLPIPKMIGEMKTKPTQHAVRLLNYAGIQPDIIIARSTVCLDNPRKKKIATFCNVGENDIISAPDIDSIYEIPINFEKDKLSERILNKLNIKSRHYDMKDWQKLVKSIRKIYKNQELNGNKIVKIAIVGKYFGSGNFTLSDSYISVIEAVKHASYKLKRKPEISWLNSEIYEKNPKKLNELKQFNGIIVPGGFGKRGTEGKIKVIEFCRKSRIPFLGLCYGLQLAVIEFARNVCKLKEAHTTEIDPDVKYPVIHTLPEQIINIKKKRLGGSMRLGSYVCQLKPATKSFKAYGGTKIITERHRHRYEVNADFYNILQKKGLVFAGINPERNLVEIIELRNHPFFIATQFHPEFKSRPLNPHPLFTAFIKAAAGQKNNRQNTRS